MHAVAVLPPVESLGDVESFRRLHDPSFHRAPAHVLLVPPFDGSDPAVPGRFDHVDAGAPFDVAFGAPEVRGHEVVLPVTTGRARLEQLRAALFHALSGPLAASAHTAPALRLGLLATDAERELARRAFVNSRAPAPFRVEAVTLLLEDERGMWHAVRRRRLG